MQIWNRSAIHRRTGEHPFGGSNRVLPEWQKQLVCHAGPPGRKNNNELLQCLFLTVVDYTRWTSPLLTHPKCISGRWILVPFGVTQLVKQMCCLLPEYVLSFARINVISARIGGSTDPPSRTPMQLLYMGMESKALNMGLDVQSCIGHAFHQYCYDLGKLEIQSWVNVKYVARNHPREERHDGSTLEHHSRSTH